MNQVDSFVYRGSFFWGDVFPFLVVVFRLLRKPFLYMVGEILLTTHPVENCFFGV